MLAMGIAAASMVVSLGAVGISALAVIYTRKQTTAIHEQNAPAITCDLAGGHVNQRSGACTIYITFDGPHQLDRAMISIRPRSGLEHIGTPGSATATLTTISLDDITSGSQIEFPGQATDFSTGRIRVVMKGKGIGKLSRNVDVENHTVNAY